MKYRETERYLFSRRRLGMKYSLDRMIRLMDDLDNPQRKFRTIHIVGTNGKGSTAAILSETGRRLGFRTGRTTSPHLFDYRERIAINGSWIPEEKVTEFVENHKHLFEKYTATYFEITAAMAAWFFAREEVEWVIAEAGLGGRLDATRLYNGEGTILTGVDIEHRRILGSTRAKIAREKVSIAAHDTVLFWTGEDGSVKKAVMDVVKEGNLKLVHVNSETGKDISLRGEHQKSNAALALAAARYFWDSSKRSEVDHAFEQTCRGFLKWPGRVDLRNGIPRILFDVAHNPSAMKNLIQHLKKNTYKRPIPAVVGFLCDKPYKRMAGMLGGIFNPVITTTPVSDRKLDAEDLAHIFRQNGIRTFSRPEIKQAVALGRSLAEENILVVTGSFYVVGEAMLQSWRHGWIEMPDGEELQALS